MDTAKRPLPAVQRAYFYLVALVAIHMVVLAVANLLRVGADRYGRSIGRITGLPFVFNDFSQPRQLYREQASLAIALLVVGLPAWIIHFRVAQRAALRSLELVRAPDAAAAHARLASALEGRADISLR